MIILRVAAGTGLPLTEFKNASAGPDAVHGTLKGIRTCPIQVSKEFWRTKEPRLTPPTALRIVLPQAVMRFTSSGSDDSPVSDCQRIARASTRRDSDCDDLISG